MQQAEAIRNDGLLVGPISACREDTPAVFVEVDDRVVLVGHSDGSRPVLQLQDSIAGDIRAHGLLPGTAPGAMEHVCR